MGTIATRAGAASGGISHNISISSLTFRAGDTISIFQDPLLNYTQSTNQLIVDGVTATPTVISDTQIDFVVPETVSDGTGKIVQLTADGLSATATVEILPPIAGLDVLATAFFHVNGENTVNDGSFVTELTNLGTGSQTVTQTSTANQPTYLASGINNLPAWQGIETGSDSTRDSFNISPSFNFNAAGWTFICAGTLGNTSSIMLGGRDSSGSNITIPNGGAISHTRATNQQNSDPLTNSNGSTYVWALSYDGTQLSFYEGVTSRGSVTTSNVLTGINSIGQIGTGIIRRLNCTMGTIAYWDNELTQPDREAVVSHLANTYGITL